MHFRLLAETSTSTKTKIDWHEKYSIMKLRKTKPGKIETNIIEAVNEVLGKWKMNLNKNWNKPWFTQDIKKFTREKKEPYQKFINIIEPELKPRYIEMTTRDILYYNLKNNAGDYAKGFVRNKRTCRSAAYKADRKVWGTPIARDNINKNLF